MKKLFIISLFLLFIPSCGKYYSQDIEIQKDYKKLEILHKIPFLTNRTVNGLFLPHRLATDDEIEIIKKNYLCDNKYTLPIITNDDAMVKFYNFQIDDIIAIKRESYDLIDNIYFRIVKDRL